MSVTRTKLEAGRYELTTPAATYLAVKRDEGWAVQLDGDELTVEDRLKDCEAFVEQTDVDEEPVDETVAWSIENNPNSKAHRTVDGKVTACGLNIPSGKELDAKPRGRCGRCF